MGNTKQIWIAAQARGDDLILWRQQGLKTLNKRTSTYTHPISSEDLNEALLQTGWERAPVFACGLSNAVSSSVPTSVVELAFETLPGAFAPIHLVNNLHQKKPLGYVTSAAVQLAGFLTQFPNWDGVVCVVQDHSSWLQVSASEVVSFQDTLTPQLAKGQTWGDAVALTEIADSVSDSLSRPEALAARLSAVHWGYLDQSLTPESSAARFWGHLIGAELAATRPYWLGQNVALIADATTRPVYEAAFKSQHLPISSADAEEMLLAGLHSLSLRA